MKGQAGQKHGRGWKMANLRNALRAGGSFGLALLAGMPVMATAQTPDATDAASSSAGGEIIVTAQRKSETLEKDAGRRFRGVEQGTG
ncbi:hypothetical protein ACFSTD_05670 [Novosphingobium colocasiae]